MSDSPWDATMELRTREPLKFPTKPKPYAAPIQTRFKLAGGDAQIDVESLSILVHQDILGNGNVLTFGATGLSRFTIETWLALVDTVNTELKVRGLLPEGPEGSHE